MKEIRTPEQNNEETYSKFWKSINNLRGKIDDDELKNYVFSLIFYKYVSDREEQEFIKELNTTPGESYDIDPENFKECALRYLELGYFIEPYYLLKNLAIKVTEGTFEIKDLDEGFKNFSSSSIGAPSERHLRHIFDDINLSFSESDSTYEARKEVISKLITIINDIDTESNNSNPNFLGDIFEYLLGQFSLVLGRYGDFYTPKEVSRLMSLIVTEGKESVGPIGDPTCGTGSLLIQVADRIKEKGNLYYELNGQEKDPEVCNLARMNMIIHGISYDKFTITQGDILTSPSKEQKKGGEMAIVVGQPPLGATWHSNNMDKDERFSSAGELPPRSNATYAFVEHMIHSLNDGGCMAVLLPQNALFRGNAEKTIRKYLIEKTNYLDTVICLPANLLYGTPIDTCICVFRKDRREDNTNVYFIDASKFYGKERPRNILRDEDINRIMDAYSSKKDIDKFARNVSLEEIKENDFNLNISRYIDTYEGNEKVDVNKLIEEYKRLDEQDKKIEEKLSKYLEELGISKF